MNNEKSPPGKPHPDTSPQSLQDKIQEQLDDALANSSPASDPVSIVTSQEEEDWGETLENDTPKAPGSSQAS